MHNSTPVPEDAPPLEARYANFVKIGHNAYEFVLDFGQSYGDAEPQFHTRIVLGPAYAKALLETLGASVKAFAEAYGPPPQEPVKWRH